MTRLLRLSAQVKAGVELGFHLCYGDLNHRHFVQPKDTSLLVEMANQLAKQVQRPIQWVQLPVPKDRTDDSYFAPLKQLKLQPETQLSIGLIHPYNLEGTLERIKRAQIVVQGFGVSTECGSMRLSKPTPNILSEPSIKRDTQKMPTFKTQGISRPYGILFNASESS